MISTSDMRQLADAYDALYKLPGEPGTSVVGDRCANALRVAADRVDKLEATPPHKLLSRMKERAEAAEARVQVLEEWLAMQTKRAEAAEARETKIIVERGILNAKISNDEASLKAAAEGLQGIANLALAKLRKGEP